MADPARRYLAWAAAALIGTIALAGAVNVIVDPYDVFRIVRAPGFNAIKPSIESHVRLAKAYQIYALKPEAIVLGNSRVEMGVDTDRRGQEIGIRLFNAGLPGSTIYELHRYMQHSLAIGSLNHVLIALDVFSFNTVLPQAQNDFLESRLMMRADNRPTPLLDAQRVTDIFNLLVAWNTVEQSVQTVVSQHLPGVARRSPTGFDPLSEQDFLASQRSYGEAFARKDRNYLRRGLKRGLSLEPSAHWPEGSMIELRRILDLARASGVRLTLFIHPYHAHVLEILDLAGQWETYEAWKRAVTAAVAAEAAAEPGREPYPVWDFGDYNTITTERVPPPGETGGLVYYWDSAHYKWTTGRMIGERMLKFGRETPPADFGVALTPGNIEGHLAATRAAQARYRAERPEEIARLATIRR